jgi:general L-amino acid transport system permease protein
LGYAAGNLLDRYIPNAKAQRGTSRKIAGWLLMALPIIAFGLVYGTGSVLPLTNSILPLTNTQRWGGLLLTLIATISAIIFSFPIGILLALGRRSTLPAISLFCTMFIEFVRGVPFITILFMSQLLVPLVNPALASMPGIFRAIIGTILFTAAYLAENVRGGLQAVPPGQEEAAKALGLSGLQITLFVTLPQALRVVIPALVGMCIALFMDTSLFVIVGLLDLVGISNNVVVQSDFLGDRREVLVFITVIYFVISYAISMISRKIEASGAGKAMARKI